MAKVDELTVTISFAWWWRPYCYGLIAMAFLTQRMPKEDRMAYWCKRAIRMKYL